MKKALLVLSTVLLVAGFSYAQIPAKQVKFSLGVNFDYLPTDPFVKYLEEQNNMKITPISVELDAENSRQQLNLWAAAGTLPNVFMSDIIEFNVGLFWKWANDGVIRDIPEYLINKYPIIKENFADSPWMQGVKKIKGKFYGIPIPGGADPIFDQDTMSLYYRADWLKSKAGMSKPPTTVDELYTYLKKCTNPKSGTYGLVAQGYPFLMHCYWGVDPEAWIQENGKWIPARISKKNVPALKFFQRLYKERIMDPEFFNNNANIVLQKFASDKYATLFKQADSYWVMRVVQRSYLAAHPKLEVKDAAKLFGLLPYLVAKAGDTPMVPPNPAAACMMFSYKTTDEQIDRWMSFAEWSKKTEPRNIIRYGFPGKDFDMVNGEPVRRVDEDGNESNPRDLYPSNQISNFVDFDGDIHLTDSRWAKEVRDMGVNNLRARYPYVEKENFQPRLFDLPSIRRNNSLLSQEDMISSYTKMVISIDDVEKAFDKWVDNKMKLGLKQVIDDVNREMAKSK